MAAILTFILNGIVPFVVLGVLFLLLLVPSYTLSESEKEKWIN